MADLRISQLPPLTGAILQADDALAIVDGSASETKKISSKDLIQSGIALIDAGSIPGDKLNVTVPAGSIGTAELANGAVTAEKLANNSTAVYGAALPTAGVYQGQLAVLSADGKPYIWSGSAWAAFGTGIESVTGGQVGNITTTATTVGSDVSVYAQVDDSTVPAAFLAGPSASAGAVELRTIVPADLPIASTTTAGIVTVPFGGGLGIDGGVSGLGSDLVIDNDIAPSSDNHLVAYNEKGLIVGGRAIQGGDLPIATNGSVGGISAGPEFAVTPAGQLQIKNQVSAAGHPYVNYDSNGLITSGRDLADTDIPDLDASKITTGTFPTALLADGSVTRAKLADYSTVYIQEVQPPITGDDYIGVGWYQESTGQLRLYNGNSWMPVGFGRLSNDNLRWGGIVDATTGFITGVTDSGQNAGLTIGQPLPDATNALGGLYVVVGEAGDQIQVTPGVTYDAGDWCLCINENEGWVRIDTMSGGGSGGASNLNDLLDVTITGPASGQYLQLQANGQWQNVELTADVESVNGQTGVVVLDAGDVGALAPGDDISELNNDSGFITAADIPAVPVTSVNSKTGDVVLDAADVGALPDTTPLSTSYPSALGPLSRLSDGRPAIH